MTAPLDSDLMRSFLAVADTGSVTAAAARLSRTQSAVSLQIKRLEESLGQPLFDRQARGVSLTPRGDQLLPYARRVVALLDEAAIALREKPLVGPVRVGIPDEYSGTVLPRALAAFDERHEGVQVSIRCDHAERQLQALEEDLIDLAIDFARHHLKPSGCLLVKCFNISGYTQIVEKFRQEFRVVTPKKPKASRDKSSEVFLLGRGLKNPA